MGSIRQQGGLSGAHQLGRGGVLVAAAWRLFMFAARGAARAWLLSAIRLGAGFTKRAESVYDPFGAGHSSTSISAALGMAVGRDCKSRQNNVIGVSRAQLRSRRTPPPLPGCAADI